MFQCVCVETDDAVLCCELVQSGRYTSRTVCQRYRRCVQLSDCQRVCYLYELYTRWVCHSGYVSWSDEACLVALRVFIVCVCVCVCA